MKYPRQKACVIDQLAKGPGNYQQNPALCCHKPRAVVPDPIDGRGDVHTEEDLMQDSDGEEEMIELLNTVEEHDLQDIERHIQRPKEPKKLLFDQTVCDEIIEDLQHHFDLHNLEISRMRKNAFNSLHKILLRNEDLKTHLEFLFKTMAALFEEKMPKFDSQVYDTKIFTKYDKSLNSWLEQDQATNSQKVFLKNFRPPICDLIAYDIIIETTRKHITKTAKEMYEKKAKQSEEAEEPLNPTKASQSTIRYMAGHAIFRVRRNIIAQQERDENKNKINTELEIAKSILQVCKRWFSVQWTVDLLSCILPIDRYIRSKRYKVVYF